MTRVLGLGTYNGAVDDGFTDRTFYDKMVGAPLGSAEVLEAYNQAREKVKNELQNLPGRGQTVMSDPVTVILPNTQSTDTQETGRTQTQTTEITVGPGSVIIGDRDAQNPTQLILGFGDTNVNVNTHTTISRDVTVTTTHNAIYQVSGTHHVSPIVLDMSNSGLLQASNGEWRPHAKVFHAKYRALFDFYGNGFPVAMEWVGPNDGLLVEPKADGSVDGTCLFGSTNGYSHGYEQLATRDANLDGKVSGKELQGLSIWQDKNGNAQADAGELRSVQELGITSLDLKHNQFKSSFTMKGKTQAMFDWWPTILELKKVKQSV